MLINSVDNLYILMELLLKSSINENYYLMYYTILNNTILIGAGTIEWTKTPLTPLLFIIF